MKLKAILLLLAVQILIFSKLFSQTKIDSLETALENAKVDTLKVDLLIELSEKYQASDGILSLKLGEEAIQLANQVDYTSGLIKGYGNLGRYHARITSDFDQSFSYFQKQLDYYKKTNNKAQVAKLNGSLGAVSQMKGDYTTSLKYLFESLNISKELKDKPKEGLALVNISSVYRFQEEYTKALEYNREALDIFDQLYKSDTTNAEIHSRYAYCLLTIGIIFQRQGEINRAIKNFQKALTIEEKYQIKTRIANICNNLGEAYLEIGAFRNSRSLFEKSLKERENLGQNVGTAHSLLGLAEVGFKSENLDEAISYCKNAFLLSEKLEAKENIKKSSELLYKIYKRQNRFDSALYYHEIFMKVNDELFNIKKIREINRIETTAKLKEKEGENAIQAAALVTKNIEIKQQQIIAVSSILFLVLGVVLIVVLLKAYRSQSQHNQVLLESKEETLQQNEEIKQQNESINAQKEELNRLNKLKDKLFSIISHDFRSPLNSLKGTLFLLTMDGISAQEIKKLSIELREKVDRTSILLENILNWAKTQMSGITVAPQIHNINDLIEENILLFQYQAEYKKINIKHEVQADRTIYADIEMVKLVIRNLLSNAIKFTENGGLILFKSYVVGRFVEVEICNTGKGIPLKDQSKIFNEGIHFSTTGTENEIGTGLGLLLCKEFIEANHGKIRLESTPEEYTSVFFSLPIADEVETPYSTQENIIA